MTPSAPLTPDERRRAASDDDALETLGALGAELGPDAPGDDHDAWLAWRARELRAGRAVGAERWDEARVARAARRARRASLAAQARLRSERGRPETVGAPQLPAAGAAGTARGALGAAAAAGCAPWLDLAVAAGVGRELWDEPVERWVRLPDMLPRGEFVALTVAGDSMEPLLHAGDVVLTQVGTPPRRDAIVVARRDEHGYVVKRVGRIDEREIELLSVNEQYPPVRIPRAPDPVVGTVVMRWCQHEDG